MQKRRWQEIKINYSVKGDRALGSGDEDKLGFRDVAKQIATSLVDRAPEGGLVIGLEGAWGSGKWPIILYLIADELGKLPKDREPTVIKFQPWLIGNRDALITSLLNELSRQLDQVALNAGDTTRVSVAKAKQAGEALRQFMDALTKAGSAIEVAGDASGFGPVNGSVRLSRRAENWWAKEPTAPQLSELKDKLARSLRELGHRFICCHRRCGSARARGGDRDLAARALCRRPSQRDLFALLRQRYPSAQHRESGWDKEWQIRYYVKEKIVQLTL